MTVAGKSQQSNGSFIQIQEVLQQKEALGIGKIEILCSGRRFYTTEGVPDIGS